MLDLISLKDKVIRTMAHYFWWDNSLHQYISRSMLFFILMKQVVIQTRISLQITIWLWVLLPNPSNGIVLMSVNVIPRYQETNRANFAVCYNNNYKSKTTWIIHFNIKLIPISLKSYLSRWESPSSQVSLSRTGCTFFKIYFWKQNRHIKSTIEI